MKKKISKLILVGTIAAVISAVATVLMLPEVRGWLHLSSPEPKIVVSNELPGPQQPPKPTSERPMVDRVNQEPRVYTIREEETIPVDFPAVKVNASRQRAEDALRLTVIGKDNPPVSSLVTTGDFFEFSIKTRRYKVRVISVHRENGDIQFSIQEIKTNA